MDTEKDKKTYELAVLVKGEGELSAVAAMVGQHGGEMAGGFNPKRIAFAYPVEKQKDGIFAYGTFHAYPDGAKKLEESLRASQNVLRFLMLALRANANTAAQQPAAVPPYRRVAPASRPFTAEPKAASHPLSNEALEKKIEEILQ